ncbi:MAG: peptide chain release factor N(5)-glutamine methyltransferase [Firmicutes bacterium]|nr:peptide chain release factor N(5)-glutamine methyltransferase [Bacillota bacterium]
MQKSWRIKDLVEWTTRYFFDRGMQESRLEAEVLLAHVLEKNRVYLYANPDVLIPRPDTEILVETALRLAREGSIQRICDVGTGSGAIAISLAFYLPDIEIFGLDLSPAALRIARENALQNRVKVDFREGNLLEPVQNEGLMDMITANLPYVTAQQLEELEAGVRDFEPHLAMLAPGDGLDIYRQLLAQTNRSLRPGGYVLMEIDPRQAERAMIMVQDCLEVELIQDGAGRDRLIKARRCH